MAEEDSSLDAQFERFKTQFRAEHPELVACPRAMLANLQLVGNDIERRANVVGQRLTDEMRDLLEGFAMLNRFFHEEFAKDVTTEL